MKRVGEVAPDFDLASQSGQRVRLSELRGKNVVLFFYPKDGTTFCTKEACAFRDKYERFSGSNAVLLGISSGSAQSHEQFRERNELPFDLLVDEGAKVRKAYGIPATFGVIPGRATFVIGKDGVIRGSFAAQFAAGRHAEEALAILRMID